MAIVVFLSCLLTATHHDLLYSEHHRPSTDSLIMSMAIRVFLAQLSTTTYHATSINHQPSMTPLPSPHHVDGDPRLPGVVLLGPGEECLGEEEPRYPEHRGRPLVDPLAEEVAAVVELADIRGQALGGR